MARHNGVHHSPRPDFEKGFRPPPKRTATLKFTDGDYAGAEVVCSLGGSVDLVLALSAGTGGVEGMAALLDRFGREVLLSWNIKDDDGPVPPSGAGLRSQDLDFSQAVVSAWLDAKAGVDGPLGPESSNGNTSAEPSTVTAT